MIHKSKLLGKYVTYLDPQRGYRTEKVVKIDGNTLSVQDATKSKPRRIFKDIVKGRQLPKRGLEEIDWSRQKPKKKPTKKPEQRAQKSESVIDECVKIVKPQKQLKLI